MTGPNGLNDTFAYNGLGQRVAKTDSTGAYALVSDGASPAADVLADGAAVYTPGLSSRKNGSSEFRHGDLLGSLRFLTDANQNVVANRLFSAFGSTVASSGDPSTPFGWVGDGESQTDADTGLVLMGHRLYDSQLGRFLSQDPIGDGDNWYAYADNDPVDNTDPSGLSDSFVDPSKFGMSPGDGPSAWGEFHDDDPGTYDFFSWNQQAGKDTYDHSVTIGPSYLDMMMQSTSGPMMGAGPAGGMFAGHAVNERHRGESNAHYFFRGLWWAIQQTFTSGADPGTLGAQGPPSGGGAKPVSPDTANIDNHAQNSMVKRGWTSKQIEEAFQNGAKHPAKDFKTGDPATRYVHPNTGKSVIINDKTGRIVHVGDTGFQY